MYKIKAKKGYNIIINDISLTVQSDQENWAYISKELFDNSKDALKVKHLLIIEDANNSPDNSTIKEDPKIDTDSNILELKDKVFIRNNSSEKKVENVFIADHSNDEVELEVKETEVKDTLVNNSKDEEKQAENVFVTDHSKDEVKVLDAQESNEVKDLKEIKIKSTESVKQNKITDDKKQSGSRKGKDKDKENLK